MTVLTDIMSWIFLLSGGFFVFAGGVGFLRMPDLYTRMHASSLTESLGAILILVGLMFQGGLTLVTVKLVIMLFFLLFTGPTAAYALANAALLAGVEPQAKRKQKREEA
ncbi:monovalent cation/H(+) antiporter subunit G [Paremcibacter congregatus]|uniref:monovalent cation/H(+) antiporter subunit G n=1 Tax=Paremcibacter congregatus TaxID=2043170 RepID=UPI003A919E3B